MSIQRREEIGKDPHLRLWAGRVNTTDLIFLFRYIIYSSSMLTFICTLYVIVCVIYLFIYFYFFITILTLHDLPYRFYTKFITVNKQYDIR